MTPVTWMIGASVLSGLAAVALFERATGTAVLLGMLGPLSIATANWILVERTYRQSPERVTALMVAGFAGKMVFFGVYVIVMLRLLSLPPIPFVASFTSYFIALHAMEALHLRSLFAAGGASRS
jgi:hypothetical protein